jgi:SnoaL-like domain
MAMRERPDWEAELTDEQLDFFNRARDDDVQVLMRRLREDTEFLVALARADTRPHLRSWFSELPIEGQETGWSFDRERTGAVGENAAGVEWSWTGVHDDGPGAGAFNTIAPSGRDVTMRGVTLMSVEDGRFQVRRYIDWAGLFAQIGLSLNWRTPVSDTEVPGESRAAAS